MRLSDWIDPFFGVERPGNFFTGPYLPGSVVKLGMDTLYPQSTGGFTSGRPVRHFSHTHIGGTGGASRYGNIGIKPYSGPACQNPGYMLLKGETAQAGLFEADTVDGIHIAMTSTHHVGVHRYQFPVGAEANVYLELGAVIQTQKKFPGEHMPGRGHIGLDATGASVGGFVERISPTQLCGRSDLVGGWGHRYPYSVYFFVEADRPFSEWLLGNHRGVYPGDSAFGDNCFASLSFAGEAVTEIRVGISFVSIANAREYIKTEAAQPFDRIVESAKCIWDERLSSIRIEGGSDEDRRRFYSLFARLMAGPTDLGTDNEFGQWKSGVHHFTDYYCLWDSVRNANSLVSLFDPELAAAHLNCLLDVAEHTGWLPDAWIAGHSAMIQGGSSADVLFSEARQKNIPGIDYHKALHYMRKNNEQTSDDTWRHGRFTEDYQKLGYLSTNVPRNCVSRHLEYTYQDFCISKLAELLGEREVAQRYRKEGNKLWNLWRDDMHCFAPRNPDGSWVDPFDQDRYYHEHHSFDPYFYEATSRCWSFHAWQDFNGLIARHGGEDAFVRHLDAFFDAGQYRSKEMMLHVPWLYSYAGRPDKTSEQVRWCMRRYFGLGRNGLTDNEDMGCQSAFFMCAAMGLYPVMGQTIFLLAAPVVDRAVISLGRSGKQLVITARNRTENSLYIAHATLNGKPLERAWVDYAELSGGATLVYELSETPTRWAIGSGVPNP